MKKCPLHKQHWLYTLLGIHACEVENPVQCYMTLGECTDCCCYCKVPGGRVGCWKEVGMTNIEKMKYYNWRNQK